MIKVSLFFLSILSLFSSYAVSSSYKVSCEGQPVYTMRYHDGTEKSLYFNNDKELHKIERWDDLSQTPPLSMVKATEIATNWFNSKLNESRYDLFSITLQKSRCSKHWFYIYSASLKSNRRREIIGIHMNGEILTMRDSPP